MFFVIYLMEMNVSNSGYVFEDLIFKDMNFANLNIIKNQYLPNTLCTFIIFFLEFFLFGEKLRIHIPQSIQELYWSKDHIRGFVSLNHRNPSHYPIFLSVIFIYVLYSFMSQMRLYTRLNKQLLV